MQMNIPYMCIPQVADENEQETHGKYAPQKVSYITNTV